eukprot:1320105-Amorphochlora_amoeboformis.AAC.1
MAVSELLHEKIISALIFRLPDAPTPEALTKSIPSHLTPQGISHLRPFRPEKTSLTVIDLPKLGYFHNCRSNIILIPAFSTPRRSFWQKYDESGRFINTAIFNLLLTS